MRKCGVLSAQESSISASRASSSRQTKRICHRREMAAWGHTVDLAKVPAKAKDMDGLPGRVCGKIDSGTLAPTGMFGFTPLGRVTTGCGHIADTHGNDAAFARRMANGRTNSRLANALLGIIV